MLVNDLLQFVNYRTVIVLKDVTLESCIRFTRSQFSSLADSVRIGNGSVLCVSVSDNFLFLDCKIY